jgi:hypothetical protein
MCLATVEDDARLAGLCALGGLGQPGLEDCHRFRIDLPEEETHAEVRVVVDDCGGSFELVSLGKNLDANGSAIGEWVDDVDVAAMEADVADAGRKLRAYRFVRNLCGSNEWMSGFTTAFFVQSNPPPGDVRHCTAECKFPHVESESVGRVRFGDARPLIGAEWRSGEASTVEESGGGIGLPGVTSRNGIGDGR